jgi:mono/diheme cytochrome c family protein
MHDQPRTYPLRGSVLFADGRSARPLLEGTVARGYLREDQGFYTGKGQDNQPLDRYPFAITEQVLRRGQERYNIYCSPCHDRTGSGNGIIVQRGFRRPPSYHIDRLRQQPPGYIVDTITHGFGAMPDYAAQVQANDRWAIAAYVKTLQYSQNVPLADLPPDMQQRMPARPAAAQGAPGSQGRGSAATPGSNLPPPGIRIPAAEQPERRAR